MECPSLSSLELAHILLKDLDFIYAMQPLPCLACLGHGSDPHQSMCLSKDCKRMRSIILEGPLGKDFMKHREQSQTTTSFYLRLFTLGLHVCEPHASPQRQFIYPGNRSLRGLQTGHQKSFTQLVLEGKPTSCSSLGFVPGAQNLGSQMCYTTVWFHRQTERGAKKSTCPWVLEVKRKPNSLPPIKFLSHNRTA